MPKPHSTPRSTVQGHTHCHCSLMHVHCRQSHLVFLWFSLFRLHIVSFFTFTFLLSYFVIYWFNENKNGLSKGHVSSFPFYFNQCPLYYLVPVRNNKNSLLTEQSSTRASLWYALAPPHPWILCEQSLLFTEQLVQLYCRVTVVIIQSWIYTNG